MGGSAWSPHLLGYGRHVPPLARMDPRFAVHGHCGGDVKQRSRHAESWIAGTAGHSSHWMPGTRTKGTGKHGTHERFAGRMGDQRNLEKWCRTVWGPRYVNKAASGMRGWAKGCARASIGTCRMLSPQCDLTPAFSSHACCVVKGITYRPAVRIAPST